MSCQYETTKDAAKAGDVTKLKRMIEKINNGLMTWHPETTYYAASNGQKECLEICVANNCPWDPKTTYWVAINGHKECLEICAKYNCPWDPETTYWAACYGHKECLEICAKYNCPWHPQTTLAAANNGHKKCLEYIFENCKDLVSWEDSGLEENISEFSEEIQQYLMSVKDEWKWYKKRSQNIKG